METTVSHADFTGQTEPLVLIIGAGFAGLAAARALQGAVRRKLCRVLLLDCNARTTMLPALPDYAAGLTEARYITAPIPRLLPANIGWQQEQVIEFDLPALTVLTTAGRRQFDYLVIATGSSARPAPQGWPNQASHPLATLAEADLIRRDFPDYLARTNRPHLVFSGAGYTGLELAAGLNTAAQRQGHTPRITLVEHGSEILPFLSSSQRRRIMAWLQRHDIALLTGNRVIEFDGGAVTLETGARYTDVFLCRTTGTCAPLSLPAEQAQALPDGRLIVTPELHLPGYQNVYAAGDAAAIRHGAGYLRKSVNFAIYSGARAGHNISNLLKGRKPAAFHPLDMGWVIPLMDDSVGTAFGGLPLSGRCGLGLHYLMCGLRNYNLENLLYHIKRSLTATLGRHP